MQNSLVIANRLAEIARAADWLAEAAGKLALGSSITLALRLCLEEALANVVTHAFPEGGEHAISLHFEISPVAVTLAIEDGGLPFDPTAAPEPAVNDGIERATIGGRGLTLIRSYADRVDYAWRDGRNRLAMSFNRERSEPDK